LNTFGEKNLRGIQRTRRGINGGALGDPFASNLLSLVETLNLHGRRERWKERGERAFTVLDRDECW
jgi:hypothetical protein